MEVLKIKETNIKEKKKKKKKKKNKEGRPEATLYGPLCGPFLLAKGQGTLSQAVSRKRRSSGAKACTGSLGIHDALSESIRAHQGGKWRR